MVPVGRDSATTQHDHNSANAAQRDKPAESPAPAPEEGKTEGPEEVKEVEETAPEPKGDPEMAPVYLKRLLPIFTQVYQGTMLLSVRWELAFTGPN